MEEIALKITEKKDQPGCIREYSVEVEREKVESKINEVLIEFKKEATIPGFRKGKTPLPLIIKRFGKDAQAEAIRKILPDTIKELVKEENLNLVNDSQVTDYSYNEGEPLKLKIVVEYYPEIPLSEYKGLEVDVVSRTVTDEDIDTVVKKAQESNAIYLPKDEPDAAVEETDGIAIDYDYLSIPEEARKKAKQENFFVKDLKDMFDEKEIEQIIGKKKGDVIEFERGGDTHTEGGEHTDEKEKEETDEKGKKDSEKIRFVITIKEIKKKIFPEIDDEFAKDLGDFKDLADLKNKIREDLEKNQKEKEKTEALEQIAKKIIEGTDFDVPFSVRRSISSSMIKYDSERAQQRGTSLSDIFKTDEQRQEYASNVEKQSTGFVKYNLIIGEIAKRENLQITDEEVSNEIEQIAEKEGRKPLAVRAELEKEKRLESLKNDLFVRKVENFLLENTKINYVKEQPKETNE